MDPEQGKPTPEGAEDWHPKIKEAYETDITSADFGRVRDEGLAADLAGAVNEDVEFRIKNKMQPPEMSTQVIADHVDRYEMGDGAVGKEINPDLVKQRFAEAKASEGTSEEMSEKIRAVPREARDVVLEAQRMSEMQRVQQRLGEMDGSSTADNTPSQDS